jgi:PASTA domain
MRAAAALVVVAAAAAALMLPHAAARPPDAAASLGPGPAGAVRVPDVVGMGARRARAILSHLGLRFVPVLRARVDRAVLDEFRADPAGRVTAQRPAPGTPVGRRAQVLVFVRPSAPGA